MKEPLSPSRLVEKLRSFQVDELHPGVLFALFYLKWALDARDANATPVGVALDVPPTPWASLSEGSPAGMGERVLKLFEQLEARNPSLFGTMADLVGNAEHAMRRSPRAVTALIYAVDQLGRVNLFPEDAGSAEEVSRSYRQLAEHFFNSRAVDQSAPSAMLCRLLVELAQPQGGDIVFDPWASWGETLRYALQYQKEVGEDDAYDAGIFGLTHNSMMLRIAKMLADVSRQPQPDISFGLPNFQFDEELDELREGVDFVISAPQLGAPFSVQDLEHLEPGRRPSILGASESRAIHFALDLIHEHGAVLLAMPPFVLNRGQQLAEQRRMLLERDLVDSVILLPLGATARHSIQTAILILRKEKRADRQGKVFFITVPESSVRSRRLSSLEQGVFREVVESYQRYETVDDFATSVDVQTLLENEADLNPSRYTVDLRTEPANIAEIRRAIVEAEQARDRATGALNAVLNRLNGKA